MNQLSPTTSELARRLLAHEAAGRQNPEDWMAALNEACGKLHGELVNLVGSGGVYTLVGRALNLAMREFPLLGEIGPEAEPPRCLREMGEALNDRDPEEVRAAATAVLAHLIGLLVTFLGEELGLRPIRKIWPEVASGGTAPNRAWSTQ